MRFFIRWSWQSDRENLNELNPPNGRLEAVKGIVNIETIVSKKNPINAFYIYLIFLIHLLYDIFFE